MPTPTGIVVKRDFWRVSIMGGILINKANDKEVLEDFLAKGVCALPLVYPDFYPGDYPTREEYEPNLTNLKRFGIDQWEAYWGIKPGDRIVLVVDASIVAKGTATSRCIQNKKANPTTPEVKYEIYFHVLWDAAKPNVSPEIKLKKGGTFFDRITDDEDQLRKSDEFDTKIMTRPSVETLNLILCGPPGTGKTYRTKRTACEVCLGVESEWYQKNKDNEEAISAKFNELTRGENPQVEFVTFHPSYDYSDFIEGFRPKKDVDGFTLQDGILLRLAKRAKEAKNIDKNYLLVIDEINRGNISKIFGETITLVEEDKRKMEGSDDGLECMLPASQVKFSLPPNLYIRGTMNTADRSIAMLDIALRRRFEFEEVQPDPELLEGADVTTPGGRTIKQSTLMKNLNEMLLRKDILGNRDYQIGHAWFAMPKKKKRGEKETNDKLSARIVSSFKKKIIPLLQEWLYDTPENLWGTKSAEGGTGVLGGIFKQDNPDSINIESIYELQEYLKNSPKSTK